MWAFSLEWYRCHFVLFVITMEPAGLSIMPLHVVWILQPNRTAGTIAARKS